MKEGKEWVHSEWNMNSVYKPAYYHKLFRDKWVWMPVAKFNYLLSYLYQTSFATFILKNSVFSS